MGQSAVSTGCAARLLLLLGCLSVVGGSARPRRLQTLQDKGVWHKQLPGILEVGNFTQPVSLQIFLKGYCQDDHVLVRGQMFALPLDNFRWSLSHAHLLQPKQIREWRPQLFFMLKSEKIQVNVVIRDISPSLVEPPWRGPDVPLGDGLLGPMPFNATLPANLSDEVWTAGIAGWEYAHYIHPASDLRLQCTSPQTAGDRHSSPAVIHVLPTGIGKPTAAAVRLIQQHIEWDQAVGFKQTVVFVTKEGMREHLENEALWHLVRTGHAALILWDDMPYCRIWPYCEKVIHWALSLLLFWEPEEKWLFMSDLDEILVFPRPTSVVSALTGCLNSSSNIVLPRHEALCPLCTDDKVKPWEAVQPLSFFTQRRSPWLHGKSMVSTHKTLTFGIHYAEAEEKRFVSDESCAYVMHLVNFFKSRVEYNNETLSTISNVSDWLWPLQNMLPQAETSDI